MVGILIDTGAIFLGGIIGNCFKKYLKNISCVFQMLGIAIMFMSIMNIVSNTLVVENNMLQTKNIILIVFCLLIGSIIGEKMQIDRRLGVKTEQEGRHDGKSAFLVGTMLFGVGGLQIIGPISSIVSQDNSILLSKSLIDFPLALSMGSMLGIGVSLSGISVGIMQLAIGLTALYAKTFFDSEVIAQLSSMGYIILFFVGFNMVFDGMVKVKTNNMIPSIALVVLHHLFLKLWAVV